RTGAGRRQRDRHGERDHGERDRSDRCRRRPADLDDVRLRHPGGQRHRRTGHVRLRPDGPLQRLGHRPGPDGDGEALSAGGCRTGCLDAPASAAVPAGVAPYVEVPVLGHSLSSYALVRTAYLLVALLLTIRLNERQGIGSTTTITAFALG